MFDTPIVGSDGRVFINLSNSVRVFGTMPAPFSAAQYSAGGGNVTIAAGRDIIHLTTGGVDDSSQQLPVNWLYRRSSVADGAFARGYYGDMASTTWWIDYSGYLRSRRHAGRRRFGYDRRARRQERRWWSPPTPGCPIETISADGSVDALAAHQPLFDMAAAICWSTPGVTVRCRRLYVERGQGVLEAGGSILTNATRSATAAAISATTYRKTSSTGCRTTLFLGKGRFRPECAGRHAAGLSRRPVPASAGVLNGSWARPISPPTTPPILLPCRR